MDAGDRTQREVYRYRGYWALDLTLNFDIISPLWYGARHSGSGPLWGDGTRWGEARTWGEAAGNVYALSAGANSVAATNNGNTQVNNATVTITAGNAAVTSVRFVNVALGVDWTWAGTLPSTKKLVVDTGAQRITNDGVKAYAGYSRAAGHTVDQIIAVPLPPGATTYTVTLAGGGTGTTLAVDFWDGWS